eukprot:scaffold6.g2880.t1
MPAAPAPPIAEAAAQQPGAADGPPGPPGPEGEPQEDPKDFGRLKDGAKVLAANKEARKPGALLDDDPDTFVKNDCRADKWVLVELSQVAKLSRVALAQYELYSSRVRDFELRGRQSHPRTDGVGADYARGLNSSQWRLLGNFTAEKRKGVQMFAIEQPVWVRFVLLRFLSHYGSEPVCAVNALSLFGKSAAEELEDALAAEENALPLLIAQQAGQVAAPSPAAEQQQPPQPPPQPQQTASQQGDAEERRADAEDAAPGQAGVGGEGSVAPLQQQRQEAEPAARGDAMNDGQLEAQGDQGVVAEQQADSPSPPPAAAQQQQQQQVGLAEAPPAGQQQQCKEQGGDAECAAAPSNSTAGQHQPGPPAAAQTAEGSGQQQPGSPGSPGSQGGSTASAGCAGNCSATEPPKQKEQQEQLQAGAPPAQLRVAPPLAPQGAQQPQQGEAAPQPAAPDAAGEGGANGYAGPGPGAGQQPGSPSELLEELLPLGAAKAKGSASVYELLVQEIRSAKVQQKLLSKALAELQRNASAAYAELAADVASLAARAKGEASGSRAHRDEGALRPEELLVLRVDSLVKGHMVQLSRELAALQLSVDGAARREHAALSLLAMLGAAAALGSGRLGGGWRPLKWAVAGLALANGLVGLALNVAGGLAHGPVLQALPLHAPS